MKRVGMISLGCPKNLVDAEIMLGQLRQEEQITITSDGYQNVTTDRAGRSWPLPL